jgi:hypothetical protein
MIMKREPPNLSPSFTFEEKNKETMMSQEAHHCLLHLRKKLKNDNKPLDSPLSITPKIK